MAESPATKFECDRCGNIKYVDKNLAELPLDWSLVTFDVDEDFYSKSILCESCTRLIKDYLENKV